MNLQEQIDLVPGLSTAPLWFKEIQAKMIESWKEISEPVVERVKFQDWPLYQTELVSKNALENPLHYSVQAAIEGKEVTGAQLVHVGNTSVMESMKPELSKQGVIVMDLFDAMHDYPDLVKEHLFQVIPADDNRISAYNTAYLNGGVFVYVPDNVELDEPIEVTLHQDSRYNQAFNKHVLIVVGKHSRIDYLERLTGEGNATNTTTIQTEIIAKDGARVKYMAMDTLPANSTTFIQRYARAQRDATIDWALGVMNDGDTIEDINTLLEGNGSQTDVSVIGISDGEQVQGINSKFVNKGYNSIGNIFQHGVILDKASLTFNGIGHILKNAKYADAQQESRVLMLSDQARGDANPMLMIDEFEVTAGHAASIGQIDEEQLYYLMSRGLTEKDAEYLVIRGFLGQVVTSMPSQDIRREMVEIIDGKLSSFHAV